MSSSNCCFLTCMQISQEAGQVIWYSHLFKNFPQFVVIHTVKGFGLVSKTEVDINEYNSPVKKWSLLAQIMTQWCKDINRFKISPDNAIDSTELKKKLFNTTSKFLAWTNRSVEFPWAKRRNFSWGTDFMCEEGDSKNAVLDFHVGEVSEIAKWRYFIWFWSMGERSEL